MRHEWVVALMARLELVQTRLFSTFQTFHRNPTFHPAISLHDITPPQTGQYEMGGLVHPRILGREIIIDSVDKALLD